MNSIDNLRDYVLTAPSICSTTRAILVGYIDGIEREVADMRGFCERLDDAATKREDVTLWGVDYTPLPLDADGVPIHVGDVMEWRYDNGEFEVIGIGGNTLFYIDKDSGECEWTAAGDKRHHHAPTVEDVLTEFGIDWEHESDCEDRAALLREYAAKLRLAEGSE